MAELRGNENTSELVRRADQALYAAKDGGRDACWYHSGRECFPIGLKTAEEPKTTEEVDETEQLQLSRTEDVDKPQETNGLGNDEIPGWDSPHMTFTDRPGLCQQVRSRIAEWKRGGTAFTLLFVEIDALKGGANQSGKAASDLAARRLAQVIAATTREMDVVARFSSTSFAMLLPRTQLDEALSVTKRLQDEVGEFPLRSGNDDMRISISAGLAGVVEGDDLVRLLRRTESALRSAQGDGGGTTHVHNGQWAEQPVGEISATE
jgi:diguanylate cyclase (GGDEF)-like protein